MSPFLKQRIKCTLYLITSASLIFSGKNHAKYTVLGKMSLSCSWEWSYKICHLKCHILACCHSKSHRAKASDCAASAQSWRLPDPTLPGGRGVGGPPGHPPSDRCPRVRSHLQILRPPGLPVQTQISFSRGLIEAQQEDVFHTPDARALLSHRRKHSLAPADAPSTGPHSARHTFLSSCAFMMFFFSLSFFFKGRTCRT